MPAYGLLGTTSQDRLGAQVIENSLLYMFSAQLAHTSSMPLLLISTLYDVRDLYSRSTSDNLGKDCIVRLYSC